MGADGAVQELIGYTKSARSLLAVRMTAFIRGSSLICCNASREAVSAKLGHDEEQSVRVSVGIEQLKTGGNVLFNSFTFLVFFSCVVLLYHCLSSWTAQKRLLLVASYVFYAAWYPPYLGVLLLSTGVDWWIARRIWLCTDGVRRKQLLLVSLFCNLGTARLFQVRRISCSTICSLR